MTGFGRVILLIVIMIVAGCSGQRGQQLSDVPTLIPLDTAPTAFLLTQNAPPEGFRETVSFPEVDANLNRLTGWRYLVTLEFDGVFARTPRQTNASARAEVWFNQLGSSRRVVVETSGELIGQEENSSFEAVRMGPDAFLVRDSVCLGSAGDDAETAADLRAGLLVGGVTSAAPTGRQATLNGEEVWEYHVETQHLNLPAIRLDDDGTLNATGELWVAPEHNAVIRFYVNLDVENAFIFDRQLPVTGQVLLRYDLFDIGNPSNITVPFGC